MTTELKLPADSCLSSGLNSEPNMDGILTVQELALQKDFGKEFSETNMASVSAKCR